MYFILVLPGEFFSVNGAAVGVRVELGEGLEGEADGILGAGEADVAEKWRQRLDSLAGVETEEKMTIIIN